VMRTTLNACSDMILPVSNNTRELLIKHGLNSEKIVTVHNAIDLHVFDNGVRRDKIDFERKKSNKPTIVNVANLIPIKGHEFYLMAATEVLKNNPAKFYVIGGGPRRKYLEELAYDLGIEEDVVFTGRIQWPDIYYILSNTADICVSSSISENFPFYILECMAARKPIVATDVGGVSEAVMDGVNGYLVPPRDPTSLAKAILRLINDPDKAREMGLKGRRLVEQRFSMDVITRKLNDVYELALKRK
jgi:glycosyltransferase involved in cell wall biosynthesis